MRDRFRNHCRALTAALFCFAAFAAQAVMAAEEVAAEGHEEKSSGLPQLDASTFPSQLFWLAVTFAVLYFYFSKKALPEISSVIENRHEHVQGNLQTAESLRKEADDAQSHYEALLDHARNESSKLMADAAGNVKAKGEKKFAAMREKGMQDLAALEQRLTQEKKKAMAEMDVIAAEIASKAAEKIVGIKADLKQAQTVVQSLNRREAA